MVPDTAVERPSSPSTMIRDSSDSIINRKREHRGILSSFSSNLGRPQISPPRAQREFDAAPGGRNGNSVKSIVAWIESSKKQSPSAQSKNGGTSGVKQSADKPSSPSLPLHAVQQTVQMPPDVEEYSLTLLRYRQYFTEKPLVRCLDNASTSGKSADERLRGEKKSPTTQPPSREVKDQHQHGHSQPSNEEKSHKPPRHSGQVPKVPQSSDSSLANPTPPIPQKPHDAQAFWKHVRDYLWISDKELEDDTVSIRSQAKGCHSTREGQSRWDSASRGDTTASSGPSLQLPPDRQTQPRPSVPSGDWKPTRRKRLLTTEEKMSEIDAFLEGCGQRNSDNISSSRLIAA